MSRGPCTARPSLRPMLSRHPVVPFRFPVAGEAGGPEVTSSRTSALEGAIQRRVRPRTVPRHPAQPDDRRRPSPVLAVRRRQRQPAAPPPAPPNCHRANPPRSNHTSKPASTPVAGTEHTTPPRAGTVWAARRRNRRPRVRHARLTRHRRRPPRQRPQHRLLLLTRLRRHLRRRPPPLHQTSGEGAHTDQRCLVRPPRTRAPVPAALRATDATPGARSRRWAVMITRPTGTPTTRSRRPDQAAASLFPASPKPTAGFLAGLAAEHHMPAVRLDLAAARRPRSGRAWSGPARRHPRLVPRN